MTLAVIYTYAHVWCGLFVITWDRGVVHFLHVQSQPKRFSHIPGDSTA